MILNTLKQAEQLGALRSIDYHFARFVAPQNAVALAAALISLENHHGHVCLPLHYFSRPHQWFNGQFQPLATSLWQQAHCPDHAAWRALLKTCSAVGSGDSPTPLVLEEDHLYLHRLWSDECQVATFFRHTSLATELHLPSAQKTLTQLFPESTTEPVNWQKVAIAVAISRKIAIILGGAGTGKTSTVTRILAALLHTTQQQPYRIKLAAPTGKAAARLSEAIQHACKQINIDDATRAKIPTTATTLHRLLGAQNETNRWHYHSEHRLPIELLVIDEASMIDLPMMARIVSALPPQARLILLGDPHQLCSVEAGAVLRALCTINATHYSSTRITELNALTGYQLESGPNRSLIADHICILRHRYRFQTDSAIDQLTRCIQHGDHQALLHALRHAAPQIKWYELLNSKVVLHTCVLKYRIYLKLAMEGAPACEVITAFNSFRLLCALRQGPFGVQQLNQAIEQALQKAGLINPTTANPWYLGRPVLVTANYPSLGLSNGDVGMALPDPSGRLRIYFPLTAASEYPLALLPSCLPAHETVYAMTIHKAQGSEFEHVALLLPNNSTPFLTRELLYTAITRAKTQLSLYATSTVLRNTLKQCSHRYSRLSQRVNQTPST